MRYESTIPASFIERPNRFIAFAALGKTRVKCHVKNTGRCRELLLPDAEIILQHHPDAAANHRKTEYSLINVYKQTASGKILVNLDSQAPNQVAEEWLLAGGLPHVSQIKREVRYGSSRFDLSFLQDGVPSFMEVKGVTLEQDGIALFPDAPTERGIKHIMELEHAASESFRAYLLFVIAMKGVRSFQPNMVTHPAFGEALSHAAAHGVTVLARDCIVMPDSLSIDADIPVILPPVSIPR